MDSKQTMKVDYLNLPRQFNKAILWAEIKKIFETCQFILGPEVERFESEFAKICGTRFALGVNSGTDALLLALKALDVGPGDEVITVPNSFVASVGAIVAVNANPVFVDVGSDYNIDPSLIEAAITPHTKVILPVHLTGNMTDMPAIMNIAEKHQLFVVEDAAHAAMAAIGGKRAGSFGDIGCFSLHPLKNLNVCGDGGAVTTDSENLYRKIKLLRNHGLKDRDEIEFFGYNSRLDSIQAVVACNVMRHLPQVAKRRQENALRYDQGLRGLDPAVIIPPRKENYFQVYHTYVIQVERRDELREFLADNGVETKIHYPIPIHLQKPCREMGYKKGDFPVCERQSEKILTLSIHQFLTPEQIDYVVTLIRRFYS